MLGIKDFATFGIVKKNRTEDRAAKRKIERLIRFVQSNKAQFETCHFQNLFENIHPNLKTTFNLQYRMHPAINETIKQFYLKEGGLECGLIHPVDLGVDDSNLENFASRYHGIEIADVLDENTHVLWLNVNTPELKQGTSRINVGEAEAIECLLKLLNQSKGLERFNAFWDEGDIEERQIGVITFYGAQAGLLKKLENKVPNMPLRISPVDRFQGMERNIIIVSTVRSNCIAEHLGQQPDYEEFGTLGFPTQSSLGFAEFPNRLNVALSRAKRLLIIVGNAQHFSKEKIYKNVLATIEKHPNGKVLDYSILKNTIK